MVFYDEFKQFYDKFPRRDNTFYYQQFPEGNQSTIRNYKYRCGIAEKTTTPYVATNNKTSKLKKKSHGHEIPPEANDKQDSIDDSWFEMEDPELARHTYRRIILSNESTNREVLEASSKLVDLKYKSGTLDTKTQTEKEVRDKLARQSTSSLIGLLKKNLPEEA